MKGANLKLQMKEKLKLNLMTSKKKYLINDSYTSPDSIEQVQSSKFQQFQEFDEKYQLLDKIGQGANGIVYQCLHKKKNKLYAVKKSKCDIEQMGIVKSRFRNTLKLRHESIIHEHKLYVIPQKRMSMLVMELFDHPQINTRKISNQKELAKISYQLLEAIAYMHGQGVCHRDIKPDNILYDEKNQQIKITDFGESKEIRSGKKIIEMFTCTGTLQYKAPQLFRGGVYDELIDEWAAGVTIYELITRRKPFDSEYKKTIIENIEECRVNFEEDYWEKHPMKWAKELIQNLLCPREKRITAKEALSSLWFEGRSKLLASTCFHQDKKSFGFTSQKFGRKEKEDVKMGSKQVKKFLTRFKNNYILDENFVDSDSCEDGEWSDGEQKEKNRNQTSTECKSPLFTQDLEQASDLSLKHQHQQQQQQQVKPDN